MDAREHAEFASEMLDAVAQMQERIANLTAEERLEREVTGAVSVSNANAQFTIDLAQSHALTALALVVTEPA